jgi:two-component system sensor histidine kinase QseC
MKQPRLSTQTMLAVGFLVILVLSAAGTLAYRSVKDEIAEVYDSQMVNSAIVLWSLSRDDLEHGKVELDDEALPLAKSDQHTLGEYAKWRTFRVWHYGQLIRSSENMPIVGNQPTAPGFRNVTADDAAWRFYTLNIPNNQMSIEVGEKKEARDELIAEVIRTLFFPLLIGFPFIMVAIWVGTRWGLRDLRAFAQSVRARSSTDLSPIETTTTPVEILPLASSLNTLLSDLSRSLEQEQRFTDNAAHELRTPLATLSVQADVILNSKTATERKDAATELNKGVVRASRLIDQLLTLARVRHAPMANSELNLYAQAREAIMNIYPKALQKGITLSLSGLETAVIQSKPALLPFMLNNLLDNAIKYAPAGSEVDLSVTARTITICDQGPGIAEQELELVFKRFYRAKGANETGSGLGLSIVSSIADILHAKVQVGNRSDQSGLHVVISFET